MNDLGRQWIEALRSGEYKQGQKFLSREVKGEWEHCCLGVLCQVAGLGYTLNTDEELFRYLDYTMDNDGPSWNCVVDNRKFKELLELHPKVSPSGITGELMKRNDTLGQSFDEIADYLEEIL